MIIAAAGTLVYDYPQEIVASVGAPESRGPLVRFVIPRIADAATREPSGFDAHFAKLRSVAIDQSLWPEDAEPPSDVAIAWAQLVIQQLEADDLMPTRVVASAEGGVGICFIDGIRYADIECLNSGTILAVISNTRDRPIVWQVEPTARGFARASEGIREFINASKAGADEPERPNRR